MASQANKNVDSGIEVEYVDPRGLALDESNVRKHSERNMQAVRDSLDAFGPYQPLAVVDADGIVRVGNARIQAAIDKGYEQVPIVRTQRRGKEAEALAIADNRTAELAEWDDGLVDVLAELQQDGNVDHLVTGFTDKEIAALVSEAAPDPEPEQDAPPEPPADPVTRAGDVWAMGEMGHRVMCGDCANETDLERLCADALAEVVFTDPPYGVNYTGGAKRRENLQNDHLGTGIYEASLPLWRVADTASLYLWYADAHAAAGWDVTAQIIWVKNNAQFVSAAHYKGKHEPCFYAHRRGKSASWHGPNNEVTVWECDRSAKNEHHPTQKPVELAARAIGNSSAAGDLVFDGFLGGGTTLIAAHQLGRRCFGMEISPQYVDVICKRYLNLTGESPVRESDGAKFSELIEATK